MRIKKKLNIASAVLLIVTLVAGVMGAAPVSAEVTFPLSAKAELSVDFLGISEGGTGPAATAVTGGITGADVGKVFWIGVAVTDSYKLTENFTANGIYNMEIAFDYDPDFIVPCADITGNLGTTGDAASWLSTLRAHNMTTGADMLSPLYWDSENYEFVDEACAMAADPDTDLYRESTARDGDKMLFVSVRTTESSADYRLKGSTADDTNAKKYLIRLPFKVVSVPAGGIDNQSLKMALGPQTFVLGSGTDGYSTYAAWEKEDKTEAAVNLKNYFDFAGDVVLFIPEGDQQPLTGITIFEYIDSTAGDGDSDPPVPREYDLYSDREMTEVNKGFAVSTLTYYAAVDYDVEGVTLRISPDVGTDNLTVYFGDETTATPLTADAAGAYIDTGPMQTLNQVDPTVLNMESGTLESHFGFNNKIIVTAYGGTTYTIYIRRYLKPEIVLNYGNSPVGMIMSDDVNYPTQENKTDAINDFKSTRVFSDVTQNLSYYENAWTSYDGYNGDDDATAMFVFQRTAFKDVGFTAYDSMGAEVDSDEVSIELTMTAFKGGFVRYDSTDTPVDIEAKNITGNGYVFTEFINEDIRPDVYEMKYTFEDEKQGTVTMTRKVIAISVRGDVYIDDTEAMNGVDATYITSNTTYFDSLTVNSLYKFRIADAYTDDTLAINGVDATYVTSNISKGLGQFYVKLPEE